MISEACYINDLHVDDICFETIISVVRHEFINQRTKANNENVNKSTYIVMEDNTRVCIYSAK